MVTRAHSTFIASKLNDSTIQENLLPMTKSASGQPNHSSSPRHLSLLDQDINFDIKTSKSLSQPISPETIEPIVVKKEERTKSLTKTILDPPSNFKTSPVVKPRSRPQSIISDGEGVSRMDGADLRFMDESSSMIMLPSPLNESSLINFPIQRSHVNSKSESNNIATNPSLLHKALLQAKTQLKQPPQKSSIASPVETSNTPSETPINKFRTEVTVGNENDNKPVTTIINKVSSFEENIECRDEIEDVPSDIAAKTNVPRNIKSDETNNLMPMLEQNEKNIKEKKSVFHNLRKRLDRKKKAVPLLGFVGNRQKSKSENRARKAFRTISFILGAFVVCW